MRLEERIVLDAAGAGQDNKNANNTANGGVDAGDGDAAPADHGGGPDAGREGERVLLVDRAVRGSAALAESARDGVTVLSYDSRSDTLADLRAMLEAACQGRDVLSIALAGHGEEAVFRLAGDAAINLASLASDPALADFLRFLGERIREGGRIDILSCDFAKGSAGAELMDALEALTGVDFAASTDETGNAERGGDWYLETDGVDAAGLYFDAGALSRFGDVLGSKTFLTYYPDSVYSTDGQPLFDSHWLDFLDWDLLLQKSLGGIDFAMTRTGMTGNFHFTMDFDPGLLDLSSLNATDNLTRDYYEMNQPVNVFDVFYMDSATGDIYWSGSAGELTYLATYNGSTGRLDADFNLHITVTPDSETRTYDIDYAAYNRNGHLSRSVDFDFGLEMLRQFVNTRLYCAAGSDTLTGRIDVTTSLTTKYGETTDFDPGIPFNETAYIYLNKEAPDFPHDDDTQENDGDDSDGGDDITDDGQDDSADDDGDDGEDIDNDDFQDDIWEPDPGFEEFWRDSFDDAFEPADGFGREFAPGDLAGIDFFERASFFLNELMSGLNTLNEATARMLLDYSSLDSSTGVSLYSLVDELAREGEELAGSVMKAASDFGKFSRSWNAAPPPLRDGMGSDRVTELVSHMERMAASLKTIIAADRAFSGAVREAAGPVDAAALRRIVEERYREVAALAAEQRRGMDRMFFDLKAAGATGRGR